MKVIGKFVPAGAQWSPDTSRLNALAIGDDDKTLIETDFFSVSRSFIESKLHNNDTFV